MITDEVEVLKKSFIPQDYDNSYLLSFEGIEGSGKSTQIKLLTAELEKLDYNVTYYREPGGTVFGEQLRSAILESVSPINSLAEANLFAASRAQLLFEKVIPLLNKKNQIVILDRYIDSSIAYQGIARGLGVETILDLHKREPLNTTCHCTMYLSISCETSFERQDKRGNQKDYFEKENKNFYQSLINGFELSAKTFPDRIQTINGAQEAIDVHNEIIRVLKSNTGIKFE